MSRRTPMLLAMLFGGIALFLAAVGIYGVLAYQVAQRRKEIGIRLALGSDGRRIFGLIVSEGLGCSGSAIALGLAGAFGDPARDGDAALRRAADGSRVVASVAVLLGLVAFAACAVPARRAARIDPLIALPISERVGLRSLRDQRGGWPGR